MPQPILPGPLDAGELKRFTETFLYREEVFLVDEIVSANREEGRMHAILDTARFLPFAAQQRTDAHHPAHVSGGELVMATGSLGCLHAWFFHGCRWDEGWVAFGSRIHRADFKDLARLGPPLHMASRETRSRIGPKRVVLRFEFRLTQQDRLVYVGDQTAFFLKEPAL